MQQTDPRKVRVLFQGQPKKWNEVWDGNPRIARISERGDFQDLHARDAENNRPYHVKKTADRWTYNPAFRPDVGEIYFTQSELNYAASCKPSIVLEPYLQSKASPNKQWGWIRWSKLAWILQEKYGQRVTQLGPLGIQLLEGAEHIVTPNFRTAAAVLARAPGVVLPEGGLHHAAAAVGVPGVVIFGGFTPVELTGYEIHKNIGVTFDDACGLRVPCDHCKDVMAKIPPEAVAEQIMEILSARMARPVAA